MTSVSSLSNIYIVHSRKNASALAWSLSKVTGFLPLNLAPDPQSLGSAPPPLPPFPPPPPPSSPPPPPPPPPLGILKGCPVPPNQLGSGSSPGGPPPLQTVDVPSSVVRVCIGLVAVCVVMTVVMGGNLEVAAQLLGLERMGMDSASFSSCLSLFVSSSVGILMSMLWSTYTFIVFNVTLVRVIIIDRSPLTSISDFGVWDVEVVFFVREFV